MRPRPRHAQLAVNLAGAMATFLVETWRERTPLSLWDCVLRTDHNPVLIEAGNLKAAFGRVWPCTLPLVPRAAALPFFRSQLKAVMAADGATSLPGLGINPALTQVSLMSSYAAVRTAASLWGADEVVEIDRDANPIGVRPLDSIGHF